VLDYAADGNTAEEIARDIYQGHPVESAWRAIAFGRRQHEPHIA
jgi:hypothetical protein